MSTTTQATKLAPKCGTCAAEMMFEDCAHCCGVGYIYEDLDDCAICDGEGDRLICQECDPPEGNGDE